jgi:tRNA pseudouridine55 synthase
MMDEGKIYLIDKPYGWTSFDVVKKVRNALKIKKVGHAGTLDPLATGLLILCAGKATKKINLFQDQEKEYTGSFVLGKNTESHDLEREVVEVADPSHLGKEDLLNAVQRLTGKIYQVPPSHSAIKKDGKRAYVSARKGKEVNLEPRLVEVKQFEITKFDIPEVEFRIICSKGTYIRSLARDLGQLLGVGAYLSKLVRTRIGDFKLNNAYELTVLIDKINSEQHADTPGS